MSNGGKWLQDQQRMTARFSGVSRQPYTDGETLRLLRFHLEGRTILDIAFELERTWFSIQGRLAYLRRTGRLARPLKTNGTPAHLSAVQSRPDLATT